MKLEHLQNGIFEPLRLSTIDKGYFPDIITYLPNDQTGFNTAKDVIISGGKKLIEVFNCGNYNSREETHTNDIIIDLIAIESGITGTKSIPQFIENVPNDNFDKKVTTNMRYDVTFQITYISYTDEYASIIERILTEIFSTRKYLFPYDNNGTELTEGFKLHRIQSFDTSGNEFIERGYRYMALNIDLEEDQVKDSVAKLEEFTLELRDLDEQEFTTT